MRFFKLGFAMFFLGFAELLSVLACVLLAFRRFCYVLLRFSLVFRMIFLVSAMCCYVHERDRAYNSLSI